VAAVLVAAQRRARHPVREYLDALRWDGLSRVPTLLIEICGAEGPEDYLRAAITMWMIGAVARIYEPGCKFDYMLVLEGAQGQGKSTWPAVLGGEWFSDGPIPLGHVDTYQAKQFVSQRVDRYRPSYGRMAHTFARQTVLFGTTNDKVWIRDPTGGRRFWPVRIPDGARIELDLLERLRDQYWAEAVHLYRAGVLRYPTAAQERALFRPQQELRMMADSWEDRIGPWLEQLNKDWVQAAELFDDCLGMKPALVQKAHEMRIAQIMQALGWEKARRRVKAEMEMTPKQRWIYLRPGEKP
jgi:putative DNA primase/helicase